MKVFISQPMRGLAEREIKLNRAKAIESIKRLLTTILMVMKNPYLSQVSQLNYYQKQILFIYVKAGTRRAVARLNICARQIMILKLFSKKVVKYESKCTWWTFS